MRKAIEFDYRITQFFHQKEYSGAIAGDRESYWDFLRRYFPPKNILTTEEIARKTREVTYWEGRSFESYHHQEMLRTTEIALRIAESVATAINYEATFAIQKELTNENILALANRDKKQLLSFTVNFLKDYSTFSIFHLFRSHRTEVHHLWTALISLPLDGCWNFSDFKKAINSAEAEAKKSKSVNPEGAFCRRIRFLREVVGLFESMYPDPKTEPIPSASIELSAASLT